MKRALPLALVAATTLALATLPAAAQGRAGGTHRAAHASASNRTAGRTASARTGARVRVRGGFVSRPGHHHRDPFPQQVFVPGFGFRPVVFERFPVFGLGFDAHHFQVLHRRHGFFPGGFSGGGFVGNNFFAGGFFPLSFVSSSSTVIVVPQVVPVQVPVPVVVNDNPPPPASGGAVAAGLPPNWPRLRVARSSYPTERPPLAQLTLLVLKDQTIFAATDYWLEDGRIFYVTSTGKQASVALRELDWEMTRRLNAERGVTFLLRSER